MAIDAQRSTWQPAVPQELVGVEKNRNFWVSVQEIDFESLRRQAR